MSLHASPRFAPIKRSSFTLMELLGAMAIVIIIAGIVVGVGRGVTRKAAEAKCKAEIAKFEIAMQQYKREWGYHPPDSGLDDNKVDRKFLESLQSDTGKRYMNLSEFRFQNSEWLDGFDQPYRYKQPGDHNPESYDIWSLGADGTDDTADDIGNFAVDGS